MMVGMAQLVRASGCGPEGRGFETHYSPHKKTEQVADLLCFFKLNPPRRNKYTIVDEIAMR